MKPMHVFLRPTHSVKNAKGVNTKIKKISCSATIVPLVNIVWRVLLRAFRVSRAHIKIQRVKYLVNLVQTVNIKIKADKHLVKHVRSMKRRQKTKPLVLFNVVKDAITKMEPVPIAKQAFIVISQPLSPPKQQIRIVTISGLNYMTIQRSMTIQVQLIVFVF